MTTELKIQNGKKYLGFRMGIFLVILSIFVINAASLLAQSPPNAAGEPQLSVRIVPSGIGKKTPFADLKSFKVKENDLEGGIYMDPNGESMPYRYFVPKRLPPKTKMPLVLFLGVGQTIHNPALIFVQPQVQEKYPCVFVAPKHGNSEKWNDASFDTPSSSLQMAVGIVDELTKRYPFIDQDRLYVTGLSAGGVGVWDTIAKFPGKFAAAVPISGGWEPTALQKRQRIAVWAFYNNGDIESVCTGSEAMLKAVAFKGGTAQKTVYAVKGHDAWTAAYSEPDLFPWLFQQKRSGRD